MAIYEQPVRVLIFKMVDEIGPAFTKEEAVQWFAEHYPLIKQGTVHAHLIRFATNVPTRLHYNPKPDEDLLYRVDPGNFRLYDPGNDPSPIHADTVINGAPEDQPEEPGEFAYESDLRDFLAKNLSLLEPGLQLYQEEGITGVEFPAGGRFIDLLAVDAQERYVVIELKVSKGYDRVIGQLLRYMAWIEKNHADPGQAVRGIIAARQISNDLKLACSYLPNVKLFEYELSVKLHEVAKG